MSSDDKILLDRESSVNTNHGVDNETSPTQSPQPNRLWLKAHYPWLRVLAAEVAQSPQPSRDLYYGLATVAFARGYLGRQQVVELLAEVEQFRRSEIGATVSDREQIVRRAEEDVQARAMEEGIDPVTDTDGEISWPSPRVGIEVLSALGIDVNAIVTATSRSHGYRLWSTAELEAVAAYDALDPWIVDGIVPRADVTFIVGAAKRLKSWLAFYMVVCVAAGKAVLERYHVHSGPVLVIYEDDQRREVFRRYRAICAGLGIDHRRLPIRWMVRQHFALDVESARSWITEEIKTHKPALVYIDSLSRVHALDENNRAEMVTLLNETLRLADEQRIGVLIVHHARKSTKKGDPSAALRGTGDLAAVARSILLVDRDQRTGTMTVDIEGNLTPSGQLRIEPQIPDVDDANPVATFTLVKRANELAGDDLRARILDVVREADGCVRKYIRSRVKADDGAVLAEIKRMVTEGLLIETEETGKRSDGKRQKYVVLSLNPVAPVADTTNTSATD